MNKSTLEKSEEINKKIVSYIKRMKPYDAFMLSSISDKLGHSNGTINYHLRLLNDFINEHMHKVRIKKYLIYIKR